MLHSDAIVKGKSLNTHGATGRTMVKSKGWTPTLSLAQVLLTLCEAHNSSRCRLQPSLKRLSWVTWGIKKKVWKYLPEQRYPSEMNIACSVVWSNGTFNLLWISYTQVLHLRWEGLDYFHMLILILSNQVAEALYVPYLLLKVPETNQSKWPDNCLKLK